MEYVNKQLLLDKRPTGMPEDDCWKLNEEIISTIGSNEIIIEVKYLSIDPYMRGRMNDSKSYAAPAKIGEPMTGETAGVVVESNSDLFNVGDKVCAHKGWQTYIKAKDTDVAPIEHFVKTGWRQGYNPCADFDMELFVNYYYCKMLLAIG